MNNSYKEIYEYVEKYIPDNRQRLVAPEHVRRSFRKTIDALAGNYRFGGLVEPNKPIPNPDVNTWYFANKQGSYSNGATISKAGLHIIKNNIDEVKVSSEMILSYDEEQINEAFKDVETELGKKVDSTSFDEYKKGQERVNASKVDKESYDKDLDAVNERINASDAGVSENKQELNGIKKLLGEAADSSKVVGTAKGGGVITFPSNVLTNASPRYKIEGATDDEYKSVQTPMRIKSVGENLVDYLDPRNHTPQTKITNGNVITNSIGLETCLKYRVYKGVSYWLSGTFVGSSTTTALKASIQSVKGYYDSSKTLWVYSGIVKDGDRFPARKLITPAEDGYHYIIINSALGAKDVVINRTGSRNFTPYTESNLYLNNNLELKSVGAVKDYIEDGKLYKNIKRHYFSKEDEWTLREDYEADNYRYYMTLPFEYKATGSGVENELLCNNFTPAPNVASVLTERDSGTIALYRENSSVLYLTLDKKVSDVNSVIPEGTFIDVILPQAEVINLDTSGMVVARPNGTVFIEPVSNLTAFYNDGLDVSSLTIEEVESFSTFKDGNYQELDVSKVSIKDGKLTHPDAVNGLCYLVYRHDNAPIYGNNEVDYYNSEKTLKSTNGKVWKKVEEATDEGELVTKLEEVK